MARLLLEKGRQAERDLPANLNANFSEVYTTTADLQDDVLVVALEGVTANTTFVVPAGYRVSSFDVIETAGAAVTGGIRLGSATGLADVVAATAVGAGAIVTGALLRNLFSPTANQTLFLEAVTAWAGASLRVRAVLEQVF